MKRFRERKISPVGSIVVGAVVSLLLSVALGLVFAAMWNHETLTERTSAYAVLLLHFAVPFVGALIAGKSAKQKYAIVCSCVSAVYCAILLAVTIFFFDSGFSGMGKGIVSCFVGGIAACAACMLKKKRRTKKA